jgi:hypothetical protein
MAFEDAWSSTACVGPDALNPAVERREASISRTRCKAPRKRLRAYVTRPPTGAAAPERLSALRFPHSFEGRKQASEAPRLARTMMHVRNDERRWNDDTSGWSRLPYSAACCLSAGSPSEFFGRATANTLSITA